MKQSLIGTKWLCTEEDNEAFGQYGTITYGEIDPDWNGDNTIVIKYEDGTTAEMKYRRFTGRHQRVAHTVKDKPKPAKKMPNYAIIPEFEKLMRTNSIDLSPDDCLRREELWNEIKYRKDL